MECGQYTASIGNESLSRRLVIVCDDMNNHFSTAGYLPLKTPGLEKLADQAELYDLINDPHEDNNLASEPRFAEQRLELQSLLMEKRRNAESNRESNNPPKK